MSAGYDAVRELLDRLYHGGLAQLLVPLCPPTHPCDHPGKTPHQRDWLARALERHARGLDKREAHLDVIARHVASGGNVGWAIPPGYLVIDADNPAAVDHLRVLLPSAPMQATGRGAHFLVRAPADLQLKAAAHVEIAPGIRVDLRVGGASQIVVQPSRHALGAPYRWGGADA